MFFGFMSPDERWDIGLNTQPTYDLDLNTGRAAAIADLPNPNLSDWPDRRRFRARECTSALDGQIHAQRRRRPGWSDLPRPW